MYIISFSSFNVIQKPSCDNKPRLSYFQWYYVLYLAELTGTELLGSASTAASCQCAMTASLHRSLPGVVSILDIFKH